MSIVDHLILAVVYVNSALDETTLITLLHLAAKHVLCQTIHGETTPLKAAVIYCVPIPKTHLKFNNPWSIVLIILAILGLLGVITATVIFAIYWNTPVIKSSGWEQMVILLIGITLSFTMAFIFSSPPVFGVCIVQSFGAWLALSLMFGALLVKIVRVAHIFFNKTTLTHLRFTEFY